MAKGPIYNISNFTSDNSCIHAEITFDVSHSIFKGHFPGNPILPGVVQIQLIKDLLEKGLKKKLILEKSKNIKFLNFISPINHKQVVVSVDFELLPGDSLKANAKMSKDNLIFIKFAGEYSIL